MKTLTREMETINPPTLACTGLKISKSTLWSFLSLESYRKEQGCRTKFWRTTQTSCVGLLMASQVNRGSRWDGNKKKKWSTTLSERGPKQVEVDMELREGEIQTLLLTRRTWSWMVASLESGKNCRSVSWLILSLIMLNCFPSLTLALRGSFCFLLTNKNTNRSLKIPDWNDWWWTKAIRRIDISTTIFTFLSKAKILV